MGCSQSSALVEKAYEKDLAGVQKALKGGADPNHKDGDTCAAIHYAARNGDVAMIKALAASGADVNLKDGWGCTALHCASYDENAAEVVETLLALKGINVNIRENEGWTPLHRFCRRHALHISRDSDWMKLVRMLVEAGADVNERNNKDKATPIHVAINNGQDSTDIVRYLVSKGAVYNCSLPVPTDTPTVTDLDVGIIRDALKKTFPDFTG
eukprot:Hpha_TRINITY_DN10325_c0_g1::TRINITY_DN10325_c0_g1_i1::g.116120::m.116120